MHAERLAREWLADPRAVHAISPLPTLQETRVRRNRMGDTKLSSARLQTKSCPIELPVYRKRREWPWAFVRDRREAPLDGGANVRRKLVRTSHPSAVEDGV